MSIFSPEICELAEKILEIARKSSAHLTCAESCTGGLIMAALTEIAGSSDVVDRGFVTYTNRAKIEILNVDSAIIKQHGAVSEECAIAMAEGALKASASTLAVSVTGIAGPGGSSAGKPVGLVHMACANRKGDPIYQKHLFGDIGRDKVREATVIAALKLFQKGLILQ